MAFHREEVAQGSESSPWPESVFQTTEYSITRQCKCYPWFGWTCAADKLARESCKGHNKPIVTGAGSSSFYQAKLSEVLLSLSSTRATFWVR